MNNSNESLEKVNTVYVYTGSVGVEALLRNKKVISRSKNYYSDLHPNIIMSDRITDEHMLKKIVLYDNKLFIRDILKGTIIGNMYNNKNIMDSDMDKLFVQIKKYCNKFMKDEGSI